MNVRYSQRSRLEETDGGARGCPAICVIEPGSGRKKKTEGIEEEVFTELDKGNCKTNQQVADMLKEKFGIVTTRQLASRLVSRWKKARKTAEKS